ncbi:MAG: hypothetical protein AAFY59_03000 [Pseudomonadota bacterium]
MTSRAQVFVFTGFRGGVLGHNETRLQNLFDRWDIPVHIFKDLGQRLYLGGGELFSDREALSSHIQSQVDAADVNIAIGASGGGYMALRQAAENRFAHCVLFSPITAFDEAATLVDQRGSRIVPELHKLEPSDHDRDAARLLMRHGYDGSVHVFYPKHGRGDVFHARNLALHDRVVYHPQNSARHMFNADTDQNLTKCLRTFMEHEALQHLLAERTVVEAPAA